MFLKRRAKGRGRLCGRRHAFQHSFRSEGSTHHPGHCSIAYALLAAVFYGTSFWLQGHFVLPVLGPVTMLWLAYLVGLIVLVVMVLKIKDGLKIPPLKNCMTLTGASLMNLGGFSSFAWGTVAASVSVVTVISTLSGGIAAILGYVFFKERLGKYRCWALFWF